MGKVIIMDGDLVRENHIDIFAHQCNCFATMGAGIARQIAVEYPEVKKADMEYHQKTGAKQQFGTVLPVTCRDGRVCVNMYSQFHYGAGKQTDYEALDKCLKELSCLALQHPGKTIGFPYGIGCGLAGGDWSIVEKMLLDFAAKIPNDVYVVRFFAGS